MSRNPRRRRPEKKKVQPVRSDAPKSMNVVELPPLVTDEIAEPLEKQIEGDWLPAEYPEMEEALVRLADETIEVDVLLPILDDVDEFYLRNVAVEFEFNERNLMTELFDYIADTYNEHYAQDGKPAFAEIVEARHGTGFSLGNIIKYAKRYGKKDGYNRKDLLKIAHYAILALYAHDNENIS